MSGKPGQAPHVLVDGVTASANIPLRNATRLFAVQPGKASAQRYRTEGGLDNAEDEPWILVAARRVACVS